MGLKTLCVVFACLAAFAVQSELPLHDHRLRKLVNPVCDPFRTDIEPFPDDFQRVRTDSGGVGTSAMCTHAQKILKFSCLLTDLVSYLKTRESNTSGAGMYFGLGES